MNNPILLSESFDREAYALTAAFERFEHSNIGQEMATFKDSVETFQLSVNKLARILGMQALNDQRKHSGQAMAYTDGDFFDV